MARNPMVFFLFIVGMLITACGEESAEPSVADRAIEEIQETYDELTETELNAPVEWAAEDLENIGDWEYKVLELRSVTALEMENALNELGNDRWEAIWIEKVPYGYTIWLKRPSISYLSKLPLSQIGRLLLRGDGGEPE